MNVFDYFFETNHDLDKDFVLGTKEVISYKDLYNNSLKIASFLNETIGENKNVLLVSPNSIFFITAYLGILKSGNVCIPLNFTIEQSNLEFISKTTETSTVFVAKNIQNKLTFEESSLLINEDFLNEIITTGNLKNFGSMFDKNRLAEIIFTSGSTGEPKGVMISHNNIIANTNAIIEYLKLSSKDIISIVLPFFYCYGLSLLHTHLRIGGSIVLNNSFIFLGAVIDDLKNYKCTGFAGVPSHFQILLKKSKTFKTTKFPDLRYVTQAGGKLHNVFIEEYVDTFPEIDFYVMYGQTEATARLSYLHPELIKKKIGSIGKGIPGVELRVVDSKDKQVAANIEGELIAKGENIMLGYFKDREETDNILKNGWLYTGDIAKTDDEGYYYLVARKKEIIKVGGKRVSPKEIEDVILMHTDVIDCTVSGINDELLGEAIKATVVTNNISNQLFLKESILRLCKEKLSSYKIPTQFEFITELKTKLTGKK
tara:strand:- start:539571 stop:541022 length:1452 start_codon:yes stop_codon:yes gene_type:complete